MIGLFLWIKSETVPAAVTGKIGPRGHKTIYEEKPLLLRYFKAKTIC